MPQTIASVPHGKPVQVFLPAHGGWYRGVVGKPTKVGNSMVRLITLSGALPGQLNMHENLTTGHATHWDHLPPDPISQDEKDAFQELIEYCSLNHIRMLPADGVTYVYPAGRPNMTTTISDSTELLTFIRGTKRF